MKYTRSDFPDGFLFGADAPAEMAAGLDMYRFSVRWLDILPDGRTPDTTALDGCERWIDQILAHNLRPCVMLDHVEIPTTLNDIGGWRNRDIADCFARFAEAIVARMGDRIFNISTSNLSVERPGDPRTEARSLHHQLLAQGAARQAMRSYGMVNLGTDVLLPDPVVLDAIFNKMYPQSLLDRLGDHLPDNWLDDFTVIAEPIDWCGVSAKVNSDIDPLMRTAREYTGSLPLFVTLALGTNSDQSNELAAVHAALDRGTPIKGIIVQSDDTNTLKTLKLLTGDCNRPAPWIRPKGGLHAHWNLVADIGGTNTRLGVVTEGKLTDLRKHPTRTLDDLQEALHYLCDEIGTRPRAVVAAGAGPVQNGTIRLTNANLELSEDALAKATGAHHTYVINDFTAAAWSVAEITGNDIEILQGEATPPLGTRLVVGPGTGLGVGALLYSEGHFHTVSGEGGHVGLSPRHLDEVEVFSAARQIVPECFFDDTLTIEAEMFLSGTGLPVLYQAIGITEGQINVTMRSAKDILQDAQDGSDACAVKAARIFTEHLGAVMGDLAVALMPTGGVFLVGGVAEKNRWLFGQDFLRAFNAGGRFSDLRKTMNLYVSEQGEFGIVGANNFCKNALLR
ncbi:glucokinase [Ruegeria halocynthiae]|uniref:Glucokinase n=1 Tax=Ruegeria halocynthiae TaxID=985054 RepID=A0A1H3E889_9RHOB|nr:family 1 glycosylhydrolase [Ruegeria halocynthiae]SDX74134.1 glucokinase [Ruegeria halocynthiae]